MRTAAYASLIGQIRFPTFIMEFDYQEVVYLSVCRTKETISLVINCSPGIPMPASQATDPGGYGDAPPTSQT